MAILEIGLIYALVALGIFITFRLLKFSDLTVDGSFTLGAFIVAYFNSMSLIAAFSFGALTGLATALLHIKLKLDDVLSSILVQLALYSINLRIMGVPNIVLNEEISTVTLFIVPLFIVIGLSYFLNTILGLRLRAVGQNPACVASLGINTSKMKIIGLMLANGLTALAGGMMALYQGFVDINLGIGTLITGLAAVIIGEQLFKSKRISIQCLSCVFGAIIYRIIIHYALKADFMFKPSDLNLITAGIVVILMIVSRVRRHYAYA